MQYILMAIVMALTCFNLSTAQATPLEQLESLRGLPGVALVVEDIGPDVQADGLSEEAVRTAVELILRSSGIRILTQSEMLKTPSTPYLYVQVGTARDGLQYSVCVLVSLKQLVSLVQRPQHTMLTGTWRFDSTGYVGKNNIRQVISNIIEPKVTAFANDFLTVNPR